MFLVFVPTNSVKIGLALFLKWESFTVAMKRFLRYSEHLNKGSSCIFFDVGLKGVQRSSQMLALLVASLDHYA